MEVILAKSAGFCFGVRRAVNEVYRCLEEEKDTPIYTFGPIIHNDEVVNDLKNKGVQVVDTLESLAALKKGIVIIRSHGVGRDTETKMRELGMRVIDMTCPFVKKIHRLVEEKSKEGYQIVIAGNPVQPEVVGIVGCSTDGASDVKDAEEAQKLVLDPKKPVFVAAQTTFHYIKFQNIVDQLEKKEYNINCVNTICNATRNRQEEAASLAASVDGMLVIGGSHSSNTQKLLETCRLRCERSVLVETPEDVPPDLAEADDRVALTAGASTPQWLLEQVRARIEENAKTR